MQNHYKHDEITEQSQGMMKTTVCPLPGRAQQGCLRTWDPFLRWGWEAGVSLYFINTFLHVQDIRGGGQIR